MTGSKFFAFGAVVNEDYFPTNGYGGSDYVGNGGATVADDSEMSGFAQVTLDVISLTAVGLGPDTVTLKDASGNTIKTWDFNSTDHFIGYTLELNMLIPGQNGFTLSSDNTNTQGVATYRTLVPTFST